MAFVTRERVHFYAPMSRDLNCDVGRRAKSVNAQPFARTWAGDARKPQRTKPDDPGAQQRRRLFVTESFRNRIDEIRRGDGILSESAVDQPSGEHRVFAKVLFALAAVFTHAARLVQPGNAHAVADL